MNRADSAVLGDFHADLLDQVALTGSITAAARACGISYRTAWSHVDRLNALSGQPVVERVAGGKSGGGTRLTAYGAGLVKAYRILQEKHARYVKGLRKGIRDFEDFQRVARGLSLKTSARNQWFGTVEKIRLNGLEAEVVLTLQGGDRLTSRITRRSARELGLRRGGEAYALVKANWVTPVKAVPRGAAAGVNMLPGVFEEVTRARGRVEASLRLAGGEVVWMTWVDAPASALRVERGAPGCAAIDPAHVILGVTDVPRF